MESSKILKSWTNGEFEGMTIGSLYKGCHRSGFGRSFLTKALNTNLLGKFFFGVIPEQQTTHISDENEAKNKEVMSSEGSFTQQ